LDEKPTELTLLDEVKKLPLVKCSDKIKSCSIIMGKTGELRVSVSFIMCFQNKGNNLMLQIATVLRCNKMELFSVEPKNASPEFKLLRSLDKCGHRSDVRAVCISSDSLAVATGSGESVKMWNRTSQSCLRSIDTGYVTSLTFVPGDRHLLAGLKSGSILILDIGTAEILEEVAAHQSEVWDICITPDSVSFYAEMCSHT
jgi:U3 small nucleolar RNA-associated protein 12